MSDDASSENEVLEPSQECGEDKQQEKKYKKTYKSSTSNPKVIQTISQRQLPPFWDDKPELWFYQIEAQFRNEKIRNASTKFDKLIGDLDRKYIDTIIDIIKDESITDKYTAAKNRLLSIYVESSDKQIRRLLTGIELGDSRPSQLYRKMSSLAGSDISQKVLKTLWMEKLPESIKSALVIVDDDKDISKLHKLADKIAEMKPHSEIYAARKADKEARPKFSENCNDDQISVLTKQVAALTKQVEALAISR